MKHNRDPESNRNCSCTSQTYVEASGPCFDLHFDRFDGFIFEAKNLQKTRTICSYQCHVLWHLKIVWEIVGARINAFALRLQISLRQTIGGSFRTLSGRSTIGVHELQSAITQNFFYYAPTVILGLWRTLVSGSRTTLMSLLRFFSLAGNCKSLEPKGHQWSSRWEEKPITSPTQHLLQEPSAMLPQSNPQCRCLFQWACKSDQLLVQ